MMSTLRVIQHLLTVTAAGLAALSVLRRRRGCLGALFGASTVSAALSLLCKDADYQAAVERYVYAESLMAGLACFVATSALSRGRAADHVGMTAAIGAMAAFALGLVFQQTVPLTSMSVYRGAAVLDMAATAALATVGKWARLDRLDDHACFWLAVSFGATALRLLCFESPETIRLGNVLGWAEVVAWIVACLGAAIIAGHGPSSRPEPRRP